MRTAGVDLSASERHTALAAIEWEAPQGRARVGEPSLGLADAAPARAPRKLAPEAWHECREDELGQQLPQLSGSALAALLAGVNEQAGEALQPAQLRLAARRTPTRISTRTNRATIRLGGQQVEQLAQPRFEPLGALPRAPSGDPRDLREDGLRTAFEGLQRARGM